MKCWILSNVALLLIGCPLGAETVRVTRDHKSIQAALDAAKPGDTVVVEPGAYRENIRIRARVILKSAGDDAKGTLGLKRAELAAIRIHAGWKVRVADNVLSRDGDLPPIVMGSGEQGLDPGLNRS